MEIPKILPPHLSYMPLKSKNDSTEETTLQKKDDTPKAILFVVHEMDGGKMYFTNESFAKKRLFDVALDYFNTQEDDYNELDDEKEVPFMEAFAKGKWANLQNLYRIDINIDDLNKISTKQKCEIVDAIGVTIHNKNFPI